MRLHRYCFTCCAFRWPHRRHRHWLTPERQAAIDSLLAVTSQVTPHRQRRENKEPI